ncbi:hypothetical protein C8Q74DRAFT_1201129, partial [Fomes fomentarius]
SLSSAPGLLAYEYMITFDRETKFFWKRSITGSSVLFIVNRYLPLSLGILQYLPWACEYMFPFYSQPCALDDTTGLHLVFSTLRAYALSSEIRGRWSILTLVLLSSLAPLIINFVGAMLIAILTMVCLIISDLLVMCITWKATYKTSRDIKVLGQGTSLSSILFRNGGYQTTVQIPV